MDLLKVNYKQGVKNMKNIKLKCFFILVIFAFLTLFVFCKKSDDKKTDTQDMTGKIEETYIQEDGKTSIISERSKILDNIEEEDMGGREFRILVRESLTDEFFIEEETGEPVDDAIYLRNRKIEERFNIELKERTAPHNQAGSTAVKSIKSGEDAYDLVAENMVLLASAALNKPFINLKEIDSLDLSGVWFFQDAVKELSVNEKLYILPGEACSTILQASYCYYFNKSLIADHGLENPYTLVLEGKWTLDNFTSMIKGLYRDLNGDSNKDLGDFYGFSAFNVSHPVTYTYSSGMRVTKIGSLGIPEFAVPNEKVYANFAKVFALHCNNPDTFGAKMEEQTAAVELFKNRQAVFLTETIGSTEDFRILEDDFGIIPFPKYDETQDKYYTFADGYASMMAVPITVRDTEQAGKIITALNAESWKTVIPQYYDMAIKVKYVRDDESVQVLDILLDGRVFDFGYIYDDWKGYGFYMWDLISKNDPNISSYFEKKENSANKNLEKVLKIFED